MSRIESSGTIPVIAAVIERDGQYLVAERPPHKRHGGFWEFPGGKLKPKESWLDAARRELKEELGVSVLAAWEPIHQQRDPGSPFEISFVPVAIAGEPLPLEHVRVRWVAASALLDLNLAPADRAFAKTLAGPG
jgi:8-oxo-dGTP pyrophosphatase MutT (NUDIX family)